jgi:hypothetical protein
MNTQQRLPAAEQGFLLMGTSKNPKKGLSRIYIIDLV